MKEIRNRWKKTPHRFVTGSTIRITKMGGVNFENSGPCVIGTCSLTVWLSAKKPVPYRSFLFIIRFWHKTRLADTAAPLDLSTVIWTNLFMSFPFIFCWNATLVLDVCHGIFIFVHNLLLDFNLNFCDNLPMKILFVFILHNHFAITCPC